MPEVARTKPKSFTKRLVSRASSLFKAPTRTPSTSAVQSSVSSSQGTESSNRCLIPIRESPVFDEWVPHDWAALVDLGESSAFLGDTMPEGKNQRRTIALGEKQFMGKGRDALCYWVPVGSSTVVLKVPRYAIPNLPVPYVTYLARDCGVSERAVRTWVQANFKMEIDMLHYVWGVVGKHYLCRVRIDGSSLIPSTGLLPNKVHINDYILDTDDKEPKHVFGEVLTSRCLLLPRAICDAYYPFRYHFSEQLLVSFVEDMLFQLQVLEKLRICHGDLKLLNILLVRHEDSYLFLLADFWDAFYAREDGSIGLSDEDHPMRSLFKWKCQSEKFGTRMYKDPCLLDKFRSHRRRIPDVKVTNPGAVNMWSLGMVLLTLCLPSKHSTRIKGQIRKIVSDKKDSKSVVRSIKDEVFPFINDTNMKPGMRATLGFDLYLWGNGPTPPFVEKIKSAIFRCILVDEDKRASAAQLMETLQLDMSISSRSYSKDLGPRCRSDNCGFCDNRRKKSYFG